MLLEKPFVFGKKIKKTQKEVKKQNSKKILFCSFLRWSETQKNDFLFFYFSMLFFLILFFNFYYSSRREKRNIFDKLIHFFINRILFYLWKKNLLNRKVTKKIIFTFIWFFWIVGAKTHGNVQIPNETPLQWLSEHLSYPDNFLHLCMIYEKTK